MAPLSASAIEERRQAGRGDGAVGVLAQLSDLGPVRVTVQPDADPAPPAYVGWPEEPARLGGGEFCLRSGQAGAPQVRELVRVMALGPERYERLLVATNQVGAP